MFGGVQRIAGARRVYPVTDRVVAHRALETVQSASPPELVHTAQWRDLHRLDPTTNVIAVNPIGRQVYLVLSTIGGRCAALLVHAPSRTVELVMIRFARARHEANTVVKCTMCVRERLLVLNDICAPRAEALAERLRAVHELVHSDHTPDAALFPLRVVARRCFSFGQVSDLRRFIGTRRVHSLSVIGDSGAIGCDGGPELRIPLNSPKIARGPSNQRTRVSGGELSQTHPPAGTLLDAPVVAAQGPDAFLVRPAPDAEWTYLAVKTLEESAALGSLDLRAPMPCRVVWDGAAWRIALL